MTSDLPQPASPPDSHQAVWDFWFAVPMPNPSHDELIRTQLAPAYEKAAAGELDSWADISPHARISLIILLDQVPRHLYRKDGRAYATDLKAQFITQPLLLNDQALQSLPLKAQLHALLPFIHAENLEKQLQTHKTLLKLAPQLPQMPLKPLAELYLKTIKTFGYFPHRKPLFGLPNTPQETNFIEKIWDPGRELIFQQFKASQSPSPPSP